MREARERCEELSAQRGLIAPRRKPPGNGISKIAKSVKSVLNSVVKQIERTKNKSGRLRLNYAKIKSGRARLNYAHRKRYSEILQSAMNPIVKNINLKKKEASAIASIMDKLVRKIERDDVRLKKPNAIVGSVMKRMVRSVCKSAPLHYKVKFFDRRLGITIFSMGKRGGCFTQKTLVSSQSGCVVEGGCKLLKVGNKDVSVASIDQITKTVSDAPRPLVLTFAFPKVTYDHRRNVSVPIFGGYGWYVQPAPPLSIAKRVPARFAYHF